MELLDALNWRYAVKQFSEEIIPDTVIAILFMPHASRRLVSVYSPIRSFR